MELRGMTELDDENALALIDERLQLAGRQRRENARHEGRDARAHPVHSFDGLANGSGRRSPAEDSQLRMFGAEAPEQAIAVRDRVELAMTLVVHLFVHDVHRARSSELV